MEGQYPNVLITSGRDAVAGALALKSKFQQSIFSGRKLNIAPMCASRLPLTACTKCILGSLMFPSSILIMSYYQSMRLQQN